MRTINLNNNRIRLYDSIDEMPILNFQKYNKYLLIDAGVGSSVDDIDSHIAKIARLIKLDDKKKAMQELQNMRQNIYMVNSEISPKYMAFAALIYSINDKRITDLSDENLKKVLHDISEIKHCTIMKFMEWLKKKVETELNLYFPGTFIDAKEKEYYDKLKKRTLLTLEAIIENKNNSELIDEIDDLIFMSYKPKIYNGADSVEIKYEKQFESICLILTQKLSIYPKNMTVLQFYNALEMLKSQVEAENKAYKSNKIK